MNFVNLVQFGFLESNGNFAHWFFDFCIEFVIVELSSFYWRAFCFGDPNIRNLKVIIFCFI